jgi:hemolysin activation/secretion protein
VQPGEVVNDKKLDDFLNLLNLNPDRYISATISKGSEPGTLAVGYDLYEIDPWHYFLQIDNSGTDDRKWSPRFGVINTNLTGRDDKLTATGQIAPGNRTIDTADNANDNYSVYGSYDFPVFSPRLRMNLYGGRSEYEIDGGQGIDFLGHGSFFGGELKLNVAQHEGWFVDVTSSLSQERSRFDTSLFSDIFGNRLTMNLWGIGIVAHRSDDISSTSLAVNRVQSISGGSGQDDYWNASLGTGARTDSDQDFEITTFSANHSEFLDADKIQRFVGSFRYISPNTRVAPAKMTTFGGMYTVRGYKESQIVADGGVLASMQYEYDLVKHDQAQNAASGISQENAPWVKKLAPLVFLDMGRAKMVSPVAGEEPLEELLSIGTGLIIELGKHFNAAVYYGFPLRATESTTSKEGRVNVGLMLRW